MSIDFALIDDEQVGFAIQKDDPTGPDFLAALTFREFIPPYLEGASEPNDVYNNVAARLETELGVQTELVANRPELNMGLLATQALAREAQLKAMVLIETTYLNDD